MIFGGAGLETADMTRLFHAGTGILTASLLVLMASPAGAADGGFAVPAPSDAATRPAAATRPSATSRPAELDIVLVRVGDTVITQADFNRACGHIPTQHVQSRKAQILRGLIGQRLLTLYVNEHPELIDEAKLQRQIRKALEQQGVETVEELRAKLAAEGTPDKLDHYINQVRMALGREALVRTAERITKDEEKMRQLFEKNSDEFNGTSRYARQIRFNILPWETPEQVQAKRNKAERIRADLVSGRRTWEECVVESECPTKTTGGLLGYVPRHLEQPEVVCEAAHRLEPGETSEVLEDRNNIYIVQVTKKHQGTMTFDEAKIRMTMWFNWEPLYRVDNEMRAKYPIVGVREPDLPPPPASRPAPLVRPQRGPQRGPTTRPARPASAPGR